MALNNDCGNTNLEKAFDRILKIGLDNKLKQEDYAISL